MTSRAPRFLAGRLIAPAHADAAYHGGSGPEEARQESESIFVAGNDLNTRFRQLPVNAKFTIGETGLGTGRNFMVAAAAFMATAPESAVLQYTAFERTALPLEILSRVADGFRGCVDPRPLAVEDWLAALPELTADSALLAGCGSVDFQNRVHLTVLWDDACTALPQWAKTARPIDAWFLDGFEPRRNPDAWSPEILRGVASSTRNGGTFATFTAAGYVRRALLAAGFDVEKPKGFGKKRSMLRGVRRAGPAASLATVRAASERFPITPAEPHARQLGVEP